MKLGRITHIHALNMFWHGAYGLTQAYEVSCISMKTRLTEMLI